MATHTMEPLEPSSIPKDEKSLAAKLAEACGAVGGVEKKGRNESQRYDYVRAADVAKAIRHELFDRGIVIIASEGELQTERFETMKGGFMTEVRVPVQFTITDGNETLCGVGWGIARDSGDKAIYKAKTGALKYFLRGLGLIPDEKDDPENDGTPPVEEVIAKHEKAFLEREAAQPPVDFEIDAKTRIALYKQKAILDACKETGKGDLILLEALGQYGFESLDEVTNEKFEEIRRWAATVIKPPQTSEATEEKLLQSVAAIGGGACSKCGGKMKPAGVSKLGKPYKAFCPNDNCASNAWKKQR